MDITTVVCHTGGLLSVFLSSNASILAFALLLFFWGGGETEINLYGLNSLANFSKLHRNCAGVIVQTNMSANYCSFSTHLFY